jgi:hypothetical protein
MSLQHGSPHAAQDRRKVWEDFRNDEQTLATLRVTPDEVSRLQRLFMLSRFTERQQLIDALNRIRCGWRP